MTDCEKASNFSLCINLYIIYLQIKTYGKGNCIRENLSSAECNCTPAAAAENHLDTQQNHKKKRGHNMTEQNLRKNSKYKMIGILGLITGFLLYWIIQIF